MGIVCMTGTIALPMEPPPVPMAVVRPARTNTWHFAATATDTNGLESDFSAEAVLSATGASHLVSLAWDPPAPGAASTIANYTIYVGPTNGTYTNSVLVGTNLSATVQVGVAPKTNRVVTVCAVTATNPAGPWTVRTNWPAVTVTNPSGNLYYAFRVRETNF